MAPVVVVAVVHAATRLAVPALGGWTWVLTALLYWGLIALAVRLLAPKGSVRTWFDRPRRARGWVAVGLVVGAFPALGILLPSLGLVRDHLGIMALVLVFAAVNPWFEEVFWRGLLLDAGDALLPGLAGARMGEIWSALWFVASHPLMWGIFSLGNRSWMTLASLTLMAVVWTVLRRRTGSLRWPVVSHALVDVGNLSVFVFLNLYVPPGM